MILLKDITLDGRVVDMLIENGKICKIQPGIESGTLQGWGAEVQVMDCRGKAAIPGFINMHTHAAMSLMRGIMEDVPFHTWLANIWKIEEKIDPDFVYWGTKVACLEMIKGGTTTFNDMYFFSDAARQAAEEMGLRPFISYAAIDQYQKEETGRQMDLCREMYEKSGLDESDDKAINALPRQIEGVYVGITVKEKQDGKGFRVSMRSKEPVSAAAICASLGGGGHRLAAGCELTGTKEEVTAALLTAAKAELERAL